MSGPETLPTPNSQTEKYLQFISYPFPEADVTGKE